MLRITAFAVITCLAPQALAANQGALDVWPDSLDGAVSVVVGKLKPNQKSIIRSASKDILLESLAEWAEDVQSTLGLRSGNSKLIAAVCKHPCTPDRATAIIMEAAWEALQK